MKKLIVLSIVLASCTTPRPKVKPHPVFQYKTVQDRIIDCYTLLKKLGENGKIASKFCNEIFKEEK